MHTAVSPLPSMHPSGEIWGATGHPVAPDKLAFGVGSTDSTFSDHGMRWDQFRQERSLRSHQLVELAGRRGSPLVMERAPTDRLLVQRNVVLGLLLALASAAWALLAWKAAGADMEMASPTMGMRAPLFLAVWVVMMVAMMFPTAARP